MLIKCTYDSKSRTLRMRYPFQSTGRHRQTDFTPKRVVVSCLHDTFAKSRTGVKSHPGATTGVNSRRGDSRQHDILWWYHVNKCRAMRGNRSELAAARKSPRCHVNTPLDYSQGCLKGISDNIPTLASHGMKFIELDSEHIEIGGLFNK